MKKRDIIIACLAILFIILTIMIVGLIKNNDEKNINVERANAQILYLNKEIINTTNELNLISNSNTKNIFKDNSTINWDAVEFNIAKLYSNWSIIIIDLNNLNIESTQLTNFGKKLDQIAVAVKNQNKHDTLQGLCDIYYLLTVYLNSYSSDEELKNNINTKYYLLKASLMLDINNWTLIYENIVNAEKCYINSLYYSMDESTQFNKNQNYVLIKELENIITTKDIDLFYFKYNLIMQNLSL